MLTPVELDRFNEMCFLDNSPYNHKMFFEHFGLKSVRLENWQQERLDTKRKVTFVIPESNPIFRAEIRVSAVQKYSYSKWGLTLLTKYSFKNEKFSDLDIETNLEVKPISSGNYNTMATCKLFVYRDDQKKVAKKALDLIVEHFRTEVHYWAKEIIEHRLAIEKKIRRRNRGSGGGEMMRELEVLDSQGGTGGARPAERIPENKSASKASFITLNPSYFTHALTFLQTMTEKTLQSFQFVLKPKSKDDYLDRILLSQFIMTVIVVYILFSLIRYDN